MKKSLKIKVLGYIIISSILFLSFYSCSSDVSKSVTSGSSDISLSKINSEDAAKIKSHCQTVCKDDNKCLDSCISDVINCLQNGSALSYCLSK